jgi:hypothetical protein
MGAAEGKTKEGRKLIRSYQKKHRTLTVSKDARHMAKLFNLYGGKKGYLDYNEAKIFVRDVLRVCELMDDFNDPNEVIDGIVRELDPFSTNKVYLSELLKPSWGRVQDVLHTVSVKINQLHADPPPRPTTPPVLIPTKPLPKDLKILNAAEVIYESPSVSESELEENCPPSFICPITTEIMTDPVILVETGTTYDRLSISQWLEKHDSDPSTGLKITSKEMIPVLALKNAIEEWKQDLIDRKKERSEKILQKQKKLGTMSQSKTLQESGENEEKPVPLSDSKVPDMQMSGSPSGGYKNVSTESNSSNENEARSSEENNIPPEVSQNEVSQNED